MKKLLIIGLFWVSFAAAPSYAAVIHPPYSEGAYILENAAQLRWFRDAVNSGETGLNAVLAADINLEGQPWIPIGNSQKNRYNGSFDGREHLIRGLSVNKGLGLGLFGYTDFSSVICNLRFEGAKIVARGGGRIQAGIVAGASRGIIQNCRVITSMISIQRDGATPAHISCGGIAGTNDEGLILDCVSAKNSIGTGDAETADARQANGTGTPATGDSENNGHGDEIGALQPDFYEYYAAGGICGMNVATMPRVGVMRNCDSQNNSILVSAGPHEVDFYGGGIVGWMLGGIIRQCCVSGGIIHSKSAAKTTEIGGIAGATSPGGYIEDSRAEGDLALCSSNSTLSSALGGAVGAMIGTNISNCLIKNVVINVNEYEPHYLGGIAGILINGKISDCRIAVKFKHQEKSEIVFVGAVAGMMSDLEKLRADCGRPTVENTFFASGIAKGITVGTITGMDSVSADIAAFPFDLSISADLVM